MEHERKSAELENEAQQLEHKSHELSREIQSVKQDWEGKKQDTSLPGAQPPGVDPEAPVSDEDQSRGEDQLQDEQES